MRFIVQIVYELGSCKNYFCDNFRISSKILSLYSSYNDPLPLEFDLDDILAVTVYSHSSSHDLIFEYIS